MPGNRIKSRDYQPIDWADKLNLNKKIRSLLDENGCTNLKALDELLKNYENLAHYLRGNDLPLTEDTKSSFNAKLWAWLNTIWEFLKSFLNRRDASSYASDDGVILRLLKLLRESKGTAIADDEVLQNVMSQFLQSIGYWLYFANSR
jgi:hypothetical protein